MSARKGVILVVIDGLTPSMLEHAVERRSTPTLAALWDLGRYGRAVTTFPSLTPVCLSSLVTGAHPDVHHIPHLVWYHRGERRVVEYGSSFGAIRAAGTRRSIRDTIFNLNEKHLSKRAVTLFEALADAGLTPAAINVTCYRGRTRHTALVPGPPPAYGPKRFFFYSLFESDTTGARRGVLRSRAHGSLDAYAAEIGRWLVTRNGFDLLVFYLPDYDYASHALGPDAAHDALGRSDRSIAALVEAAGGLDALLERYALVICSDHGQTRIERAASLEEPLSGAGAVVVTASNRAGMVYRLDGCPETARDLAARLDRFEAVEVALFMEGEAAVARASGEELRFRPAGAEGGWDTEGDCALLPGPDAFTRAWAALQNPNAGDVLVSAAPGWELTDLAGRHHVGGGSHGSLTTGDSEVPVLTVGLEGEQPRSIIEIAPSILGHFGVEAPPYAQPVARAA